MGTATREKANALLMLACLGVIFIFAGSLAVDAVVVIVCLVIINPVLVLGLVLGALVCAMLKR